MKYGVYIQKDVKSHKRQRVLWLRTTGFAYLICQGLFLKFLINNSNKFLKMEKLKVQKVFSALLVSTKHLTQGII